jgi:hypothetical protein
MAGHDHMRHAIPHLRDFRWLPAIAINTAIWFVLCAITALLRLSLT